MIFYSTIYRGVFLLLIVSSYLFPNPQKDIIERKLKNLPAKEQLSYLIKESREQLFIDPSLGVVLSNKAIQLAQSLSDKYNEGYALISKGRNEWKLDDYPKAILSIESALSIFKQLNDQKGLAACFVELGMIYINQGKYAVAVEVLHQAYEIGKKENDNEILASSLKRLGIVYWYLNQLDNSLKYYKEAIKLAEETKRFNEMASLYNNISNVYYKKQDFPKAQYNLEKAYKLYKKQKDKDGMAIALSNMGEVQVLLKQYNGALNTLFQSLKINKELGAKFSLIHNYTNIGLAYNNLMQLEKAETYYKQALSLADEIKAFLQLAEVYLRLSQNSEQQGKANEALFFYKQHKIFQDSVFNKNSSDKIAEVQTKYETKMKETENAMLKRENELQNNKIKTQRNLVLAIGLGLFVASALVFVLILNRKKLLLAKQKIEKSEKEILRKNESLAELNATKDKFFSIIAHDLKNPFSSVKALCDLLVIEYDDFGEEERKECISHISSSVNNTSYLLENLLIWARTQRDSIKVDLQTHSLDDLIDSAVKPYIHFAMNKKIKINKVVEEGLSLITDKYMMETVLGNLINNAVKFSLTESEVKISSFKEGNKIHIHVKDCGLGMDSQTINRLFKIDEKLSSRPGTIGEKGTGLGLILCKEFIEKLKGKIDVESQPKMGTTFKITFELT